MRIVNLAPEAGKVTLKAQLAAEVAHVRKVRPDLPLTAVADTAPDNWTFLEKLQPDERTVDFIHACEHLSEVSDHAVATGWYDRYCVALRDDVKGVVKLSDSPSSRQGDRRSIFRELEFFRKNRRTLREPLGQRPLVPASWRPPTKRWSTSA